MTSEVVIANANGVALAADSAVTIGNQKIYNSALKVFALSKTEPVGVMIYGNAGLMDVPWETLIKTHRAKLNTIKYDTLEEYGQGLLEYICDNKQYFTSASQENWITSNIRGYYTLIRDELFRKIHPILQKNGEISDEETGGLFEDVIVPLHSDLKNKDLVDKFSISFEKSFRKKHTKLFKEISDEIFQNLKPKRSLVSKLYEIATYLHTRQIFSQNTSGIVITGFGDKEIYPSVLTYEMEGVVEGRLKYRVLVDKCTKIQSGGNCAITPFAQDDMVSSFMNGINPAVVNLIETYLQQLFVRIPELLKDEDLDGSKSPIKKIKKSLSDNTTSLLSDFFDQLGDHIQNQHVNPVMNMVNVLPKDELASMAEALVNLTAFKRRMTNTLETVGGPVDVAVISKGDGLVWVKRKHYFPENLNQHFFRNYFRGVSNE